MNLGFQLLILLKEVQKAETNPTLFKPGAVSAWGYFVCFSLIEKGHFIISEPKNLLLLHTVSSGLPVCPQRATTCTLILSEPQNLLIPVL